MVELVLLYTLVSQIVVDEVEEKIDVSQVVVLEVEDTTNVSQVVLHVIE